MHAKVQVLGTQKCEQMTSDQTNLVLHAAQKTEWAWWGDVLKIGAYIQSYEESGVLWGKNRG